MQSIDNKPHKPIRCFNTNKYPVNKEEYLKKIKILSCVLPISRMIFSSRSGNPERRILLGYLTYMLIGFLLLMLPVSRNADTGWLDNLFTAVSAVSTTGLATLDIPAAYTIFGQCVILVLIQIGGIGYMTMSSYIFFRISHQSDRSDRLLINASFSRPQGMPLQDLVSNIIHFTFIFELLGFISFFFALHNADVPLAGWKALFLSISSFCTAGFSPFSDSLCSFSDNIAINLTVAVLSYAGAMGFIVITDILYKIRKRGYLLTFTTKVIMIVTVIMTAGGTLILFFSPVMTTVHGWWNRLLMSFFQTMSAMTTVGFNTIDLSTLKVGPILVFSLIMFIGASPSGTGGGVKSTSVTAVWGFVISKLGLRRGITFLGREIPHYRVETALTSIIVYGTMIFLGCIVLSYCEPYPLSQILFEASSAIGTVGLSTGITPELSVAGKITIIVLMYIGRIGVITFGTALVGRLKEKNRNWHKKEDLAA